MKKMIVMEFNELCPEFLDSFIEQGLLPNFKRLRDQSFNMQTRTDAEGQDLNPWVQWVDVHSGQDWQEHNVKELNEHLGDDLSMIWNDLSKKYGFNNLICGSMNTTIDQNFKGVFLPDPWNVNVAAFPDDGLQKIHDFLSKSVIGHSKKDDASNISSLISLMSHGLSLSTILKIAGQLLGEKIGLSPKWKRAFLLDHIQYDIFKYYHNKDHPQFSTFFTNSVAHCQHHYWKEYQPEKFGIKTKENTSEADAIPMAYQNNDVVLGKLMKLVDKDTAIIFMTALSQQPYTENERYFYSFVSEKKFKDLFLKDYNVKIKPIMAEQFYIECGSSEESQTIIEHLNSYVMDSNDYFHEGNNQVFLVKYEKNEIVVQCRCNKNVFDGASFYNLKSENNTFRFYDYFFQLDETKAGMHNPVGIYWYKRVGGEEFKSGDEYKPSEVHGHIMSYYS